MLSFRLAINRDKLDLKQIYVQKITKEVYSKCIYIYIYICYLKRDVRDKRTAAGL